MYFTADTLVEDSTSMSAGNAKGFDVPTFNNDYYDMDSEVSYQELFSSAQDQAVVSKVNLIMVLKF